jgi:hypothetical protein
LKALYRWRGALAVLEFGEGGASSAAIAGSNGADYAERVRAVLSAPSGRINPELVAAAANADDRLSRARRAEADLWPNAESELARLSAALRGDAPASALRALRLYHQKRANAAHEIRDRAVLLDLPDNGG